MERWSVVDVSFEVARGPAVGAMTLRVRDTGGRLWLEFCCDDLEGHCTVDPEGVPSRAEAPSGEDPLDWLLRMLGGEAEGLLRLGAPAWPRGDALTSVLPAIEAALRCPPAELDAVDPARRLPSHGEKWTTYPSDVLPLWVADMDFPQAEPVRRTLARAVARGDIGYPVHPGPTDLPDLAVERMRERFGWSPDPRHVEILTDVVQGMYVAVEQFTEPGDGVVIQTPIYPPFRNSANHDGRRCIEVPLAEEARCYRVDIDALADAIDERTRLFLLCNPHNPTGRVFSREELEGIAQLAIERDLIVVSDEIHSDLVYSGSRHIPIASLSPEIERRTITLTAASKAFNTAGLRCAVALLGSDEVAKRFRALARHIRGGVSLPGIEGLRAAWQHGAPWLAQVVGYLEANRDHVVDTVGSELPGMQVEAPEATYLAWLDCREMGLPGDPYDFFLEEAKVALSSGPSFGPPGAGFVRINFATSRAVLDQALSRMAEALRR